jgi:hypothetical protein
MAATPELATSVVVTVATAAAVVALRAVLVAAAAGPVAVVVAVVTMPLRAAVAVALAMPIRPIVRPTCSVRVVKEPLYRTLDCFRLVVLDHMHLVRQQPVQVDYKASLSSITMAEQLFNFRWPTIKV